MSQPTLTNQETLQAEVASLRERVEHLDRQMERMTFCFEQMPFIPCWPALLPLASPDGSADFIFATLERITALQARFMPSEEEAYGPWKHLVRRRSSWRRQPYIRDRNMTVRQLVGTVLANKWSEEEAAENLELPREAIQEALQFAEKHKAFLALETAFENWLLEVKGSSRGSRPVPG